MFSVHAHRRGESPAMKRKKIEKLRFYKSYDTLTTIQLSEKTHLTKVVPALKRFGDALQTP